MSNFIKIDETKWVNTNNISSIKGTTLTMNNGDELEASTQVIEKITKGPAVNKPSRSWKAS